MVSSMLWMLPLLSSTVAAHAGDTAVEVGHRSFHVARKNSHDSSQILDAEDHAGRLMRTMLAPQITSSVEEIAKDSSEIGPEVTSGIHELARDSSATEKEIAKEVPKIEQEVKPYDPEVVLSAALMMPLLVITYLAWVSPRPNLNTSLAHRSYELGLLAVYVVLSAGSTLCLRQTRGSALDMTIGACTVLYALKAVLSLGLVTYKKAMVPGEVVAVLMQRDGYMQLPAWCHLALVGSLFAFYDALSFLATQHLPPVSFQLILNSRCLLLVPLQYLIMNKRATVMQVCAMMFIAVGAAGLATGDINSLISANADKERKLYSTGIVLLIGKVMVSAVALVVNEKLLKKVPLTVDVQNTITYAFGVGFLVIGRFVWASYTSEPTTFAEETVVVMRQIFSNHWMFGSVLLMALLGLVCAYLLKAYSAVEKEVYSLSIIALLAIGQAMTPGESTFKVHSFLCAVIIIVASFTCSLNMPPTPVLQETQQVQHAGGSFLKATIKK